MTLTITAINDPDAAGSSSGVFDIVCDNNYTANGYVLTAALFSRRTIDSLIPVQKGTANRVITYDPSTSDTGKLRLWTALGTEAAGASDQSLISCRCRVVGPRV